MQLTGFGGGIMLAIAAALWLTYLLPSWLKRREYLATELNAVRLQQTIRVMAETAEAPAAVRAELAARRAAAGAQLARTQLAAPRKAPARTTPAGTTRAQVPQPPVPSSQHGRYTQAPSASLVGSNLAARRLRRTRALTSLVFFAAIAVLATQIWLMVNTGIAGGSWVVLATASLTAVTAFAALGRFAQIARARTAVPVVARRTSLGLREVEVQRPGWTPVAVPKPLYLSRSAAPVAARDDSELDNSGAIAAQAELRLAAAAAERARRAELERVATIDRSSRRELPDDHERSVRPEQFEQSDEPAAALAGTRFALMGVVDSAATAAPDLDAVLARRRAV